MSQEMRDDEGRFKSNPNSEPSNEPMKLKKQKQQMKLNPDEPNEMKQTTDYSASNKNFMSSNFFANVVSLLSLLIALIAFYQGSQYSKPKVVLIDSKVIDKNVIDDYDIARHPNQLRYVCRIAITLTSIHEKNTALTGYDVTVKLKDKEVFLPNKKNILTYNSDLDSSGKDFYGFSDFLSLLVAPENPLGSWNNQDYLPGYGSGMLRLPINIKDTMMVFWDMEYFYNKNYSNNETLLEILSNKNDSNLFIYTLHFANGQQLMTPNGITCFSN